MDGLSGFLQKKKRISKPILAGMLFCMLCLCSCSSLTPQEIGGAVEGQLTVVEESLSREVEPEETQASASEEEISFLEECSFPYYREQLTETERLWYDDMERILGGMGTEMRLSDSGLEAGMDENNIDKIFQCVMGDHPELFYVEGYNYTRYNRMEQAVAMEFSGIYSMDQESAGERQRQIRSAAQALVAAVPPGASEYEKVKYTYETIIRNTDYQLNSPDNQNIYSVLVNRASVCQGYAKAAQYLLSHLGVDCTLVQGTVDTGEGHAWNLVKVDGEYYYMDATWGDASYRLDEETSRIEALPEINYDYLCVTTDQLLRTHILGGYIPMPQCISFAANYYVREGAYFTSYDREQFRELCRRYREEARAEVTVKCADYNTFQEMQNALIADQEIFDFLDMASGTITYTHNEKQLSLSFWMTN